MQCCIVAHAQQNPCILSSALASGFVILHKADLLNCIRDAMNMWCKSRCLSCRDIVPLGQNKSNFNYNLDEKRVLNFENVVDDSDNVKQDMSIDVYGRQKDDDDAQDADKAAPAGDDAKVGF